MLYLAIQTLFWLLLAFFFGLLIGWFFWGKRTSGAQSKMTELQENVAKKKDRIEQLSAELSACNSELNQCREDLNIYKQDLAQACREVCPPEDIPSLPVEVPQAKASDAEDLKVISGVGPFLEGKLNAFGIYKLEQVAALTPDVINELGATFGSFADRIIREDWPGQAAKLLEQK